MSKLRYKRYLVKAVDDMPFEGSYDKGVIFTADDREELVAYLAKMPREYFCDVISVFDCDERMFIEDELTIGFVEPEPFVPIEHSKESKIMAELWQPEIERFFNNPKCRKKNERYKHLLN